LSWAAAAGWRRRCAKGTVIYRGFASAPVRPDCRVWPLLHVLVPVQQHRDIQRRVHFFPVPDATGKYCLTQ
jgi:hypothetical protein